MRVLLIEDDLTAARGLSLMLKSGGAVVDQADTGEEALELVRHYDYDMVHARSDAAGHGGLRGGAADAGGADRDARADRLRPVPAAGEGEGPRMGADDFITKPFDKAELLARMQAVVRRSKGFSQPTLRVGPLVLNLDSREVTVDGRTVHLTGKEYAILELLVLRKGMVLTKEAFLNHLYGGMDEPEMKIIDVFVCKLRKKLAQAGGESLIGTVWGRGYMIREPVAAEDMHGIAPSACEGGAGGGRAANPARARERRPERGLIRT